MYIEKIKEEDVKFIFSNLFKNFKVVDSDSHGCFERTFSDNGEKYLKVRAYDNVCEWTITVNLYDKKFEIPAYNAEAYQTKENLQAYRNLLKDLIANKQQEETIEL